MKLGIACLVLGYVLSQFYRAFLAVLSPVLQSELGATPEDLALSSGLWFLTFAAMQIPIGAWLDSVGPRRSTALLLGIAGGLGAITFALAHAPWHLHLAMGLIGIGCAPILMAAYYIFGRIYPPAVFATLAGATIGIGSLGNIAGAAPLALTIDAIGWRNTLWAMAAITAVIAVTIWFAVKDPERIVTAPGTKRGSLLDVLRLPGLWFIMPLVLVAHAPAAGIRGLWLGPYLGTTYGVTADAIGVSALIMAIAMTVGPMIYGPLDRVFGTRKGVILAGNLLACASLFALCYWINAGYWTSTLLFAALGLLGSTFPLMMAHGRSFLPPELLGRGVTFLNMLSIGGSGLLQVLTRNVYENASPTPPEAPYMAVFLFFAVLLAIGCAVYAFSKDRLD